MKATDRQIKAVEKLNADIMAFAKETEEEFATLYEDAYTTRRVANFKLLRNGKLTWLEKDFFEDKTFKEEYQHDFAEEITDTLAYWRANLRRAKRYWAMNPDTLDKIQDGEIEDTEEE